MAKRRRSEHGSNDDDELYEAVRPRLQSSAASSSSSISSIDTSIQTQSPLTPSPLNLSYYVESSSISVLSEQDVECIRFENGIEVEASDPSTPIAKPVRSFDEASLPTWVLTQLHTLGFQRPTPVQQQVLPCAMSGADLIVTAETGSGKTLAYVLPLLALLHVMPPAQQGEGPVVLIVAPVRELAEQIFGVIQDFIPQQVEYPARRVLGLVGGVPIDAQTSMLARGVDVIVATPGRLLDMVSRRAVPFDRLRYLVFDEADRMLASDSDMESQLRLLLGRATRCPRQTLLFSATMPTSVERLARSAVNNPIRIVVGSRVGNTARSVRQTVLFVASSNKNDQLLETLRAIERPPVLVFCRSAAGVERVTAFLRSQQFHVADLHGEKAQAYRFRVVEALKNGRVDVVVATDVASRGLDVLEIEHVIQYDLPDTVQDYTHRVGRTGRANQIGHATAFLTYHDTIAPALRELLQKNRQPIPKELDDLRLFNKRDDTTSW